MKEQSQTESKTIERVLAIETSCDDTSVAIVSGDGWVEALSSANQDLAHEPFGGIVPEVASRNHTHNLLPLIETALKKSQRTWDDIDGLVVTSRPGLVGSLLVGLVTVKALALSKNLPFIGVNHLEAHLLAPFLKDSDFSAPMDFDFPFIGLAISGGHTHLYQVEAMGQYRVLGKTIDDAAGEAFDKFAKFMGLGYPGGVQVDRLAQQGDPKAFQFPRAMLHEDHFDFSFSGLKTAGQRQADKMTQEERREQIHSLCASYQEAIVDVLLAKLDRAVKQYGLKRAVLTGGVSANSRLRTRGQEWAQAEGVQLVIPPLRYCTDNAAMVGYVGLKRLQMGERSSQSLGPSPRIYPGDFIYE